MAEETKTPEVNTEEKTVEELKKELEQARADLEKQKRATDAASSDAAKHKRAAQEAQEKYKSTLDENARKELEREEALKSLNEELASLKAEKRIATYKSKLISCGYDEATAESMAKTLPDGIGDDFFTGQKAFLEAKEKSIKSAMLGSQPGLSTGQPLASQDGKDAESEKLRRWAGL
jgi:hypothetical protein